MNARNPMKELLELQQNFLEQGQEVFRNTLDMQRKSMESFVQGVEEGIGEDPEADFQSKQFRQFTEAYFDLLEQTLQGLETGVAQYRKMTEEQLEEMGSIQQETLKIFRKELDQGMKTFDELTRRSMELFDESLRTVRRSQQASQAEGSEASTEESGS